MATHSRKSWRRAAACCILLTVGLAASALRSAPAARQIGPDGRPVLVIDGKPFPGLIMQHVQATPDGARAFGKVGMRVWEIDVWEPNNWREVDGKVAAMLRGAPNTRLLLRVALPKYLDGEENAADIATAENGKRWTHMLGRARWFTVGEITERDAPPRKWTQLTFDISRADRNGIVRFVDLVIWRRDTHIPKEAKLRFYIDDVEYFSSADPTKRTVVADMETPQGLHDQRRDPKPPLIVHDVVKAGKGALLWEHVQDRKHDALVCKGVEAVTARDMSQYDRMSLWIRPDTDAPFRIVARICGGLRRMGYPSFASERWAQDGVKMLQRLIAHIDAAPYRSHVIGLTLAAGMSAEWAWAGQSADCGLDFCESAKRAWQRFARERYRTIEALQRAWRDDAKGIDSFDQILVPGRSVRLAKPELGDFFDPRRHRMFTDYNEFIGLTTARRIVEFGEAIKKAGRGRLLVGALFSYLGGYGDFLGKKMQQTGHSMPEPVILSPAVDYLASPVVYWDRNIGCPSMWHLPVDTLQLHGKLVVNEADTPTYIHKGFGWLRPTTLEESTEVMKRDVAAVLAKGMFQWWFFDRLGGPRMLDRAPEIVAVAGRLNDLMARSLKTDRGTASEVAFVVDHHSMLCIHPHSYLPGFVYYQLPELARMGAPFDTYFLSDIDAVARRPYKLVILFNAYWLNDAQRQAIAALKHEGRTVVFVYATGIAGENGVSAENVSSVTGIRIRSLGRRMPVEVRVAAASHPITRGLAKGLAFGCRFRPLKTPKWYPERPACAPVLFAADDQAQILGLVVGLDRPGLAVRDFGTWRSVWSAALVLPAPLLRNLCRYAGVHVYDDADDIVYANRSWLALHFSSGGPRTIRLPHPSDVTDAFTGARIGAGTTRFQVHARRGDTRIFRLTRRGKPAGSP
ncbi:MAG: hypothetical protein GXP31_00860 [Kiritimatiellaeota bacterium]|nr:hypothetical protein [Kiritimatiellota bacterium]